MKLWCFLFVFLFLFCDVLTSITIEEKECVEFILFSLETNKKWNKNKIKIKNQRTVFQQTKMKYKFITNNFILLSCENILDFNIFEIFILMCLFYSINFYTKNYHGVKSNEIETELVHFYAMISFIFGLF